MATDRAAHGPDPAWAGIELLDHHCHGVTNRDLDRPAFERLLSEGPAAARLDRFDSLLGLAVRRWCAPVLDLEPHAAPDVYLRRRAELGWRETTRRLLAASGVRTWLVDDGFTPADLTGPDELADLGGGRAHRVARLESLAEAAGTAGGGAAGWADAVERAVRAELTEPVDAAPGVAATGGADRVGPPSGRANRPVGL
jgi:hypothetical protein